MLSAMLQLMLRWLKASLAEWQTFDDARIAAMDGRDALRFWRAHKDALLALARGDGRSFEPVTQQAEAA